MTKKPTYEELEQKVLELEKAELERNKAEEALRESETRYRELFVSNPHPMWVYDLASLAFLDVNNAAISHYGYSREEFLSMTIKDIRPPEDLPRLMDNVDAVGDGLDKAGIWRHIKKDGSVIDVEITSHVLQFEQHRAEMVLVQDITDRKTAEQTLHLYEQIISATNDLMSLVDRNYKYLAVNNAYLTAFGKKREEIVGATVEDLLGPEAFQEFSKEYLDRALAGEKVQNQGWLKFAGSNRHFMDVAYHPIKKDDGHVSAVVVCIHDLTKRKLAEEAINAFFDQSLVMLFIADMQNLKIVRVNNEVLRITGRTEEDIYSVPFIEFVHPEDRESAMKAMARLAEGKPLAGYRNRQLTADGETRLFEWNGVSDMERKLVYAMAQDITERRQAEEKLNLALEKYEKTFRAAPIWVVLSNLEDGRYMEVNRSFLNAMGYKREEVIGKTSLELNTWVDPRDRERIIARVMASGGIRNTEVQRKTRSGVVIDTLFSAETLLLGEKWVMISVTQEITEQKRAENQAIQEKAFSEVLINSIPSSFWMFDDQGFLVRWNKRYEEFSGQSEKELSRLRPNVFDLIPVEDRASATEAWQKVMREGKAEFEAGALRKDGSVIPFYYTVAQVSVDKQTYVLGTGVDITQLKQAEEVLKEAYDIISKSPAVAFLWKNTEAWPVEFVSVNVAALSGYEAEHFTAGKISYLEIIHPEDLKRVSEEVAKFSSVEGRNRFSHEPYRIIAKNGTVKWVKDSTFIRRDQQGHITHFHGVVEDVTESKKMEDVLRESEARFRTLVENSPAGILLVDEHYRFVYVNEQLSNILGFSRDELVGMDFRKVLDDESREVTADRYVRRQRGEGAPTRYEIGIVRKDGRKRCLEMVATAVRNPDGTVQTIGQTLDITNRKQAEERLKLSSRRLRMALQASRMGTWDWDLPTNRVLWSTETLNIFGVSAEEFGETYEAYLDFATLEVRDEVDRLVREFLSNPSESGMIHYDHPIVTGTGEPRWIEVRGTLFKDERDRPMFITGVCGDITERKQIEEALRTSEKFLQDVFDGIQDGISVLDTELNIVQVNQWMEDMYRFSGPLVGKKCYQAYHQGRDDVCPWCPSIQTLKTGKMHTEIVPYRPADKPAGWLELSSFPLKDSTGTVTGVIEHVKNITDRKKTEEELSRYREHLEELVGERTKELKAVQDELVKQERLAVLGQLTATVSHEIRNPLGAIRASSFFLQRNYKGKDEKVEKHLNRIEEQVDICNSIVEDLLEYTRGRHSQTVKGDLNSWIGQVVEQFINKQGIDLVIDLYPDLLVAPFDPEKMRRVMVNLMENAMQAVREKQPMLAKASVPYQPEVRVITRKVKGNAVIEVEDNGIGMEEETVQRVFEPFFTTRARGTGLGLAVVKRIMEEHNATISIESLPEKGTRVSINLPVDCKRAKKE